MSSDLKCKRNVCVWSWLIRNFKITSEKKGTEIRYLSPSFVCGRSMWKIAIIYAKECKSATTSRLGYTSLYLILENFRSSERVRAKFKFFLHLAGDLADEQTLAKENRLLSSGDHLEFSESKPSWGFSDLEKDGYCAFFKNSQNRDIEIVCKVEIHSENLTTLSAGQSLVNDLQKLSRSRETSDVTFLVEKKPIYAHRLILSTRSHVFASLFKNKNFSHNNNYGDNNNRINHRNRNNSGSSGSGAAACGGGGVGGYGGNGQWKMEITDISYEGFRQLMQFIYTGDVDESQVTLDLLYAAEKYKIEQLKELCSLLFIGRIGIDNAINMMIIGNENNAQQLKRIAKQFVIDNASQVFNSPSFKNLKVINHDLAMELMSDLMVHNAIR